VRGIAMLVALCAVAMPAVAGADPEAAPAPDDCPYRVTTPPAVDSSEVPKAGDPPQPLPARVRGKLQAPEPLVPRLAPEALQRLGRDIAMRVPIGAIRFDGQDAILDKLRHAAAVVLDPGREGEIHRLVLE